MKKLLFIFVISTLSLYAKPLAVPHYDPFGQTQKILSKKITPSTQVRRKKSYTLYAIYDDKVNINGNFYTVGERVGSCTLWKILQEKVLLHCHKKIKTIEFIRKKSYKRVEK